MNRGLLRMTALALVALSFSNLAHAAPKEFNQNIDDPDFDFKPQDTVLPDYPAADSQWLDLYVSPTFKGRAKLLAGSITILGNNSLTYVLNNQSASGIDNISYENLRCSVHSFMSKYNNGFRQLAFADTHNKRWLESRNAPWRDAGSNLSTTTPVQEMLSRVFCDGGMPRNLEEVNQRLKQHGMFKPSDNRARKDA